mgnify:CR=1 FL=1
MPCGVEARGDTRTRQLAASSPSRIRRMGEKSACAKHAGRLALLPGFPLAHWLAATYMWRDRRSAKPSASSLPASLFRTASRRGQSRFSGWRFTVVAWPSPFERRRRCSRARGVRARIVLRRERPLLRPGVLREYVYAVGSMKLRRGRLDEARDAFNRAARACRDTSDGAGRAGGVNIGRCPAGHSRSHSGLPHTPDRLDRRGHGQSFAARSGGGP